ncbi:TPA: hemolysin III family protein [bacterium]|nr:hemolysin III family protein [bacterium]
MARIELKKYSLGEELINSISHGVGAVWGIVATIMGILKAVQLENTLMIISMSIFGFSLINLYIMSTIYHALAINKGKRVFRVLDHCGIFLLIAGTYTPYALLVLPRVPGLIILGIVWICAIVGITFNSINLKKFKVFSLVSYLLTGWVIIFAINHLIANLDLNGLILLVAGGLAYSFGAIIYGIGSKKKYFHSIWHFFVLLGSILHYLSIYFYVLI